MRFFTPDKKNLQKLPIIALTLFSLHAQILLSRKNQSSESISLISLLSFDYNECSKYGTFTLSVSKCTKMWKIEHFLNLASIVSCAQCPTCRTYVPIPPALLSSLTAPVPIPVPAAPVPAITPGPQYPPYSSFNPPVPPGPMKPLVSISNCRCYTVI